MCVFQNWRPGRLLGGLWFFQEWDRLKWIVFKKKERKTFSSSPMPTKHAKQGRKDDSPATRRRWFPPPGQTVPGPHLPSPSPLSSKPSGQHLRTTLGECLLAASVRLRLEPHGRHMQEMRCNNFMFMIPRVDGRVRDGIDQAPNLFPGVKFKRDMLRAKSLTMWVRCNKLQVDFYWCLYRFF